MFGPLTNLAMALEMDPHLPTHLSGVICCGGSIARGGDVTAAAEFNFWADPAAAQTVLRSPIGVLLVPLDVSELPTLTFEDVDRLTGLIPSTPVGELIAGLLQYSMRATRLLLPREVVAFPAATALAVAARATKYSTVQLTMDVETTGELTSGQVVVDRRPFVLRPAMTDVVSDLDEVAVTDFFCRGLKRMAVAADMS